MAIRAIGVDIGGTSLRTGLVEISRRSVEIKEYVCVPSGSTKQQIFDRLERSIRAVSQGKPKVCIGIPGTLKNGKVWDTPNLPLNNTDLASIIKKRTGLNCSLENDANAFALAEAVYGAGKGYRVVVGLTLGTGVGGGIVVDGKIFHGRANAGELGHVILEAGKGSCCGNSCLEEHVAKRGIMRLSKGLKARSPEEIFRLCTQGNRRAQAVFLKVGEDLGKGITTLANVVDPDVFVVGGSIAGAWRYIKPGLKTNALVGSVTVKRAMLKHPGVIGCAQSII